MARENFSIGAFYNITKNQHNPIKTVGRDSFLSLKTPKIEIFRGHPAPAVAQLLYWSHSPYILGAVQLDPYIYNICPSLIEIGSKTAEKTLHKQTDKQTDRQTLRK